MNTQDTNNVADVGELQAMLEWQRRLSTTLGVHTMPTDEAIQQMVACLSVEASEAFAHFLTKTKPWKPQDVDMNLVKEEMIDVLHFLLAFFNLVGMDSGDITEAYREKNLYNYTRVSQKMQAHKEEVARQQAEAQANAAKHNLRQL